LMRRIVLLTSLVAVLASGVASAKLPFFDLEVDPLHPTVGEPITLTMACYEDERHTRPWGSCLGAGGTMAWVHPLDDEGKHDRDDWIEVEGHPTSSGATRGTITLDEPGAYDVLSLWRTWGPDAGDGFPGVIRIEVGSPIRIVPMTLTALGLMGTAFAFTARRRRAARATP
jgi:hypothetical protein